MKNNLDDVMDMSLDDYINSFKSMKNNQIASASRSEESNFKEGRRNKDEEDEFEDELTLLSKEDDYVSLALGTGGQIQSKEEDLAETDSRPTDLRDKIVGRLPKTSQQWRLEEPNVMNVRPAGMPPLIPSTTEMDDLGTPKWRNYNRKRYNNWNHNKNNNWNNNNNHNHNNRNNFSNGRIQRFNNSRCNFNSKNIKIVLEQLKQHNPMILYSTAGTPNLTIEATSSNQNSNGFIHSTPPVLIKTPNTSLPQTNVIETLNTPQPQSKGSEVIKTLLGVNEVGIRNDMMPVLAGKLLDILNASNPTVHKPIYDMKIQKEIHDIQKKPLLYKCPGGEVVSSDGAGIPDCKIQPRVSGISLNNRFA